MKNMILVLSLIGFISSDLHSQKMKGLSRVERKFVKNVIKVHNEKVVEITKRKDNHIVIEFNSTMVVLKPDGFIGETWILEDGDWLSLGTAEEAY
jgi:hypothetical protein